MAVLPVVAPRAWEKRGFQGAVTFLCALPIAVFFCTTGRFSALSDAARSYLSFVSTLGALYVVAGGIHIAGDLAATPRVNVAFLVAGAVLASVVGTTGASMLLIRPFLRTNRQRANTAHLVPFFILAVANAGGLLTPVGDPPLLVGYIEGVPFFWTLWLLPIWIVYAGSFAIALYIIDRRAYALESPLTLAKDRAEIAPIVVRGRRNIPCVTSTSFSH